MVDDDVSTLLKLDPAGFHAGGTVQAGSRPLFVASGGFTVNPPDLASARDGLRSLAEAATGRDALAAVRTAVPDVRVAVPHALDTLGSVVADAGHAVGDAAHGVRWPDARSGAASLVLRTRRSLGLTPRERSMVARLIGWTPVIGLLLGVVAAASAVVAVAWMWHPSQGAERRRRMVRVVRERSGRGAPIPPERALVAVPIEPDSESEAEPTSLASASNG